MNEIKQIHKGIMTPNPTQAGKPMTPSPQQEVCPECGGNERGILIEVTQVGSMMLKKYKKCPVCSHKEKQS